MIKKVTFIASLCDLASINIKNNILLLEKKNIIYKTYINGSKFKYIYETSIFRLIEIDEENVYQDLIDKELESLSIPASYVIFLSRHSSKSKIRSLTVHSTGNYGGIFYGGNKYNGLSIPQPLCMSLILQQLYNLNNKHSLDCDVTLEVTHHGPTKLNIPSFFVEIGSTINDWSDNRLGYSMALALLYMIKRDKATQFNTTVAIGFGGNHYAATATKLTLENKANFGHIFPKYQIKNLTEENILNAFISSNANYAYLDKKSLQSKQKKYLTQIIKDFGYQILLI